MSEDLLFQALWERVLDVPARCLLVWASVLQRPADWLLLRALTAEEEEQMADTAIRRVRDASLFTEVQDYRDSDGARRRFEVHPTVGHLARQHAPNIDELLYEGHRYAGNFLAERARSFTDWSDDLEAAYHLGEIGETDRAFDLLLSLVEWLEPRGRILDRLAVLDSLQHPELLNLQNRGRFLVLRGQAYADLGDLSQALTDLRQTIEIGERLAQQDPNNAQWQRDLSVSHDRIGDMLAAQGEGAAALTAYRASLAIAERLAQQDPNNAQWQTDVVVSYWKLAQSNADIAVDQVDRRALLERGLAILHRLHDESRLTSTQEDWIIQFERALRVPLPPRGMKRLLSYGRAWLQGLISRQHPRQ
jgi:tetratricopeptide (TPR) repeat protein